jgi:fibrillarin-like pre-rRNA processing protein
MQAKEHKFSGVYVIEEKGKTSLATRSLTGAGSVYGEKVIDIDGVEYRLWPSRRSKLSAAIRNGLREMPIQRGSKVLYLGAASGTTVSHVSDIVGEVGTIYAVEFSPKVARNLLSLSQSRSNIVPIVDDARYPTEYLPFITEPIDIVYQDVAQPNQAAILTENMRHFCSFGAWGMIAIKARSIDSSIPASQAFNKELSEIEASGVGMVEKVNLAPFEKDHLFVVVRATEAAI